MDRMIYEQELIIAPSITDADGKLGYANAFGVCMDIAAIHAESLGLGLYDLARRNLFWITVKTQLRFLARPQMMERVLVRTWPEQPGKLRGNRSYQILRGDSILISGKTEWAVMNTKTGQLSPMVDVYPVDMIFPTTAASPEPFARITDDFGDNEPYAVHNVSSADIDVGGHMNNTAYVHAILASLNTKTVRDLGKCKMDVIFRSPCFEGEILSIQRRDKGNALEFRVSKEEHTAILARIERQ